MTKVFAGLRTLVISLLKKLDLENMTAQLEFFQDDFNALLKWLKSINFLYKKALHVHVPIPQHPNSSQRPNLPRQKSFLSFGRSVKWVFSNLKPLFLML